MTMSRVVGLTTTTKLLLHANQHRKSWSIYNDGDVNIVISNRYGAGTAIYSHCMIIPPKSQLNAKIPEDNPQLEVWGYCGGSANVYLYEGLKWKQGGKRNI